MKSFYDMQRGKRERERENEIMMVLFAEHILLYSCFQNILISPLADLVSIDFLANSIIKTVKLFLEQLLPAWCAQSYLYFQEKRPPKSGLSQKNWIGRTFRRTFFFLFLCYHFRSFLNDFTDLRHMAYIFCVHYHVSVRKWMRASGPLNLWRRRICVYIRMNGTRRKLNSLLVATAEINLCQSLEETLFFMIINIRPHLIIILPRHAGFARRYLIYATSAPHGRQSPREDLPRCCWLFRESQALSYHSVNNCWPFIYRCYARVAASRRFLFSLSLSLSLSLSFHHLLCLSRCGNVWCLIYRVAWTFPLPAAFHAGLKIK